MNTDTLANGLKAVFGQASAPSATSLIPYTDASRNPAGFSSMANLASVLGVPKSEWLSDNGVDLNTLTNNGFYRAGNYTVHTHVPSAVHEAGHWGVVVVFKANSENGVVQCLCDFGGNPRTLYWRMLIGFNQGWSHWFSVPMTDAGAGVDS